MEIPGVAAFRERRAYDDRMHLVSRHHAIFSPHRRITAASRPLERLRAEEHAGDVGRQSRREEIQETSHFVRAVVPPP